MIESGAEKDQPELEKDARGWPILRPADPREDQ